jgi:hypothetical protein
VKKLILLSLAVAVLSFLSCGKKDEFKYQLSENRCDTGEHKADSKEEMCGQLKNSELNNGCAAGLRKEKYEGDGCGAWGA